MVRLYYTPDSPSDRWDFTSLGLAAALDIAQLRGMKVVRTETAPRLLEWLQDAALRASMRQTAPLPL